jgi:hypothetical protein
MTMLARGHESRIAWSMADHRAGHGMPVGKWTERVD